MMMEMKTFSAMSRVELMKHLRIERMRRVNEMLVARKVDQRLAAEFLAAGE